MVTYSRGSSLSAFANIKKNIYCYKHGSFPLAILVIKELIRSKNQGLGMAGEVHVPRSELFLHSPGRNPHLGQVCLGLWD